MARSLSILPSRNLRETRVLWAARVRERGRATVELGLPYPQAGWGGASLHRRPRDRSADDRELLLRLRGCRLCALQRMAKHRGSAPPRRPAADSRFRWTPTTGCASSGSSIRAATSSASARRSRQPHEERRDRALGRCVVSRPSGTSAERDAVRRERRGEVEVTLRRASTSVRTRSAPRWSSWRSSAIVSRKTRYTTFCRSCLPG